MAVVSIQNLKVEFCGKMLFENVSFDVNEGDTVVVGIYVKCQGSGNGAWGKIDDALLNSVSE